MLEDNSLKLIKIALPFTTIAEVPAAKMKFNPFATSDAVKNCKRHFNAPSHIGSEIMSSPLYKELRHGKHLMHAHAKGG